MSAFENALPSNLDAERQILASVLLVPSLFRSVRDSIKAGHFFLSSHQMIFRAFSALYQAEREIDPVTIQDVLTARGELESVGGGAYIGSLIDGAVRLTNIDEYIKMVREKYQARQVILFSNNLINRAMSGDTPGDLLDAMAAWLRKNQSTAAGSDLVFNRDLADRVMERILLAKESPEMTMGLRCGLERFDYSINGFAPGLATVAGYSSLGKTALALQWLDAMTSRPSSSGKKVVGFYITLEMTPEELFLRQVSQRSQVGGRAIMQGRYAENAFSRITDAVDSLRNVEVAYIDRVERGAEEIANKLDRLEAIYGDSAEYVVFVDTLQLMISGSEDDHKAVARASRENKQLANSYKVPIIQLSQITVDNKYDLSIEPHEGMLRGAKSIYHDSDILVFLHAPTGNTNDPDRQLIKRKDRWGPRVEYYDLVYNGAATRFSEVTR